MNPEAIYQKFGGNYTADERTFMMGIDQRFTAHFAERFRGLRVLETCTGAGFTTLSLARTAKHVFTVEINERHQQQAIHNIEAAGLASRVTFRHGSILDQTLWEGFPPVDAAFIDPDWAVTGPDHIFRFNPSNTQPPADVVLNRVFESIANVALVLPPFIESQEFSVLPDHECEKLYLGTQHELYCLYFGSLSKRMGETVFRVPN